ncbi:MAG: ChaB family protein [Fusobacteriaceae bacterium]|nr:ChaB family protein [Fusobacteriaceae bacterium]
MSNNPFDNNYLEAVLSLLYSKAKIIVPTDFHGQVASVQNLFKNDISGLVDSLTDFAVESADVKYEILTKSDPLNVILAKWLKNVNKHYFGLVPKGIGELAKEYARERWKGASFPILKIVEWGEIDGYQFPTKMYFVNGGAVYAKEIKDAGNSISKWEYYLGKGIQDKLEGGVIITKPFARWFDQYPVPYIIKRGVYHNWRLLQVLKGKQGEALEQLVPLLNLINKGSEALAREDKQTYDDEDLKTIKKDIEDLLEEVKKSLSVKSPFRVAPFDEAWKQLVPDITKLFDRGIHSSIERNILAGLGFIDVEEAVTASRRESVLNPKAFVGEVKSCVDDFSKILEHVVDMIIEANQGSSKYEKKLEDAIITHSAVKPFMTDKFKQEFRLLWKHGQVSNQTYAEVVGEVDYDTEKLRRDKELKEGTEMLMYPHFTQNTEQNESLEEVMRRKQDLAPENEENQTGKTTTEEGHYHTYEIDAEGMGETILTESVEGEVEDHVHEIEEYKVQEVNGHTHGLIKTQQTQQQPTKDDDTDVHGKPIPRDRLDEPDQFEYSNELEIAPYKTIKELPAKVKNYMSSDLQRVFMRVFNNAYSTYNDESRAFRIAWGVIKKLARKNKQGIWVRKKKRANGKLVKTKLTKAILEDVLAKEEKEIIERSIKESKDRIELENAKLKNQLLKDLTNKATK